MYSHESHIYIYVYIYIHMYIYIYIYTNLRRVDLREEWLAKPRRRGISAGPGTPQSRFYLRSPMLLPNRKTDPERGPTFQAKTAELSSRKLWSLREESTPPWLPMMYFQNNQPFGNRRNNPIHIYGNHPQLERPGGGGGRRSCFKREARFLGTYGIFFYLTSRSKHFHNRISLQASALHFSLSSYPFSPAWDVTMASVKLSAGGAETLRL